MSAGYKVVERKWSYIRWSDVVSEAASSLAAAPLRALVSALGIILSVAAFVTTMGLSSTLAAQVSATFDAVRSTEVTVSVPIAQGAEMGSDAPPCPALSLPAARQIAGVAGAGWLLVIEGPAVSRRGVPESVLGPNQIIAAESATLSIVNPTLVEGRNFDFGAVSRGDPVALVSTDVVKKFGVAGVGDSIVVGGRPLQVIGIYSAVSRRPEAAGSIIVPISILSSLDGWSVGQVTCRVAIVTLPGAAQQVAQDVALALSPGSPNSLSVASPPDPRQLRASLESSVEKLSLLLSGVVLLIGVVSIAVGSSAAVTARTGEFGLRKSLGSTSLVVGCQVLLENVALGLLGGLAGVLLGCASVLTIAVANSWAPVLDLSISLVVAMVCGAAGAIAGVIPAIRAANLDPVDALRR